MYETGNGNITIYRIVLHSAGLFRKSQVVSVCKENIEFLIAIPRFLQIGRNAACFVLLFTFSHFFGGGNVPVVCYTSVLGHFHVIVIVYQVCLIPVTNVTAEEAAVEERGRLTII
ncbi:hypothetical protein SDC9_125670 [bioreactor metagenome]|uniref:Uncharacterized protein n=1 Tax=bioreactor metagenome TaxID=1076179 RepID=A0A645CP33_9ZZZZ